MKIDNFGYLYTTYQKNIFDLFQKEIQKRGWCISKMSYERPDSVDLTNLIVKLEDSDSKKEIGTVLFRNIWLDFLFIDRDSYPRVFNTKVLDSEYANQIIHFIVAGRINLLDAIYHKNDIELKRLGEQMTRLKIVDNKGEVKTHFENGKEVKMVTKQKNERSN